MIIPSEQALSVPCSDHLTVVGEGTLGDNCQLSIIHRNVMKLSYSGLLPGDIITVTGLRF